MYELYFILWNKTETEKIRNVLRERKRKTAPLSTTERSKKNGVRDANKITCITQIQL